MLPDSNQSNKKNTMARLLLTPAFASCLLAACGSSDDAKTEQLQSITVTDASGRITARTTLDYEAGKLFRVRAEGMTAGPDEQSGTEDDVLGLVTAADCQIESNGDALHDSYAEAHGISPVSIFFSAFEDCALPGLSASRIKSKNHLAGPDGKLLTADDTAGLEFTLKRSSAGSRYTSPIPASSSCNVNCTGLDNIVYSPYEGLDLDSDGIYQVDTLYTTGSNSKIQSIASAYAKTIYTQNADGHVLRREFYTKPLQLAAPAYFSGPEGEIIPTQIEEYEPLSEGKTGIRLSTLMASTTYDFVASSPTGQILLAILGIGTEPPIVATDGLSYYRFSTRHYRAERSGNRLDRIVLLESAGEDGIWNSSDDIEGARVVLRYANP